ncbi:Ferrous iron transport protein A [Candidatus Cyrtobacter comes]|uniref:Ferrous iron transport protein A n=2 Tax=Candidatus Cyrtobacter comes TaxID=675776 RepID=A0ABU5L9B6_9RICK|nr:Ferrous iron transport protein A [Candidatus Cyrtobacter comes]
MKLSEVGSGVSFVIRSLVDVNNSVKKLLSMGITCGSFLSVTMQIGGIGTMVVFAGSKLIVSKDVANLIYVDLVY